MDRELKQKMNQYGSQCLENQCLKKDVIHLKSPGNWINDPNGFIYYKGMYHLFYQYFPYAPVWGTMHWGHAVSPDLVHWEHQGIALFPTRYEDQNGCFSGSALEKDGRLYLFYTGVHYIKPDPENIHVCMDDQYESSQLVLISEDGKQFDNFNGKHLLIPVIRDSAQGDPVHTRDPKVWRGKDAFYMVLGSTMDSQETNRKTGRLLVYKSTDLMDWKFISSASKPDGFGWMWECPDYFETPGGGVLVFSPMGFLEDGYESANQSVCALAEFNEAAGTMEISDEYQYMDYGLDLYAPQTTTDAEGRRVLTAWLRMAEPADGKWTGMFCIPRIVEVSEGHIYFRVHPNIRRQFQRKIDSVCQASGAGYLIRTDLFDGEEINIGGYRICYRENRVYTDRSSVMGEKKDVRMRFQTPDVSAGCALEIYVEPHLIEIFVNDGEYVISSSVCRMGETVRICRTAESGMRAEEMGIPGTEKKDSSQNNIRPENDGPQNRKWYHGIENDGGRTKMYTTEA